MSTPPIQNKDRGNNHIYKRIVLKLSGESLSGPDSFGIHPETVSTIADDIKAVRDLGVEVAIVVGGGNIFPWHAAESAGHRTRHRRLHGNVVDSDQWHGADGCT